MKNMNAFGIAAAMYSCRTGAQGDGELGFEQGKHVTASLLQTRLFVLIFAVEKIQAMFTILKAFGTVTTCHNSTSTRFSMVMSLDFNATGRITAAHLQVTLHVPATHPGQVLHSARLFHWQGGRAQVTKGDLLQFFGVLVCQVQGWSSLASTTQ